MELLSTHHADLFHQHCQVVEEFLLDDLAIVSVCDGAELDFKAIIRGRNLFASRPFIVPENLAMEQVQSL